MYVDVLAIYVSWFSVDIHIGSQLEDGAGTGLGRALAGPWKLHGGAPHSTAGVAHGLPVTWRAHVKSWAPKNRRVEQGDAGCTPMVIYCPNSLTELQRGVYHSPWAFNQATFFF